MKVDWTDYALFSALARTGSLAGAAADTGVSQATLSRRMRAFETRIGRRLFLHGGAGYALTPDGAMLADQVARMAQVASDIDVWRAESDGPVCVRISAGTWTALDLCENLPRYWAPNPLWVPEFVHSEATLDIARREVDIGLRSSRPAQAWLAGQQVGETLYAVYATAPEVRGFIALTKSASPTASSRWVWDTQSDRISTKANTPFIAAAMARAGVGRVVLPTFVGDRMAPLHRVSDPIDELQAPQWLVSHQDMRHTPAIRAALNAIRDYLHRRDATPLEPSDMDA